MKKLLISVLVFVAIASSGGIISSAHADELTPAERAALQQSLNVLTAKLLELRAQASALQASSPAVSGAPLTLQPQAEVTALSPEDAVAIKSALTSLAAALSGLQSVVANNPQLVMVNARGISLALQGMGSVLAKMGTTLVAQAAPSAAAVLSVVPPALAPSVPPVPRVPSQQPLSASGKVSIVSGGSENVNAQSAQAASSWSLTNLNWPVIVVGFLVILAVILWLWWPAAGGASGKDAPAAPVKPMPPVQPTILTSSAHGLGRPSGAAQTPLAAAMSAPTQKSEASTVKVVPPQPQQRKPA